MTIRLLSVTFSLLAISSFGQHEEGFREKMIESGEKQEKSVRPENANSINDYQSYRRTQAWNSRVASASILTNTKELDIPIIGGRVRASLVDEDNNIMLTAPSGGGLWKFKTDGSSFTPLNDLGAFLAVTGITQNPFNKQQIIIGTGDEQHATVGNGLFVSTDGGNSFTQLASTNPSQNSDFKYIRFVKFSPQTQNTIYITAGRNLYKSTDAGSTWTLTFTGESSIRSVDFVAGTGVIVAVSGKGVYRSTTGSANSFTLVSGTTILEAEMDNIVVASHAANRNIAYALTEKDRVGRMFKTTNGGTTWTETTVPSFYVSQGWFCLTIGVHPTDPNIVVGGSVGWGYTKDGGTTWTTSAELEVDFHDVHFHPSNPDVAYIGYDQGLGRVDFGKTATYWAHNGTEYVQEAQAEQIEIGKKAGFNTTQIYYGDYFPSAYGDAFLTGQQDGGSFAQVNGINYRVLVGDGGTMFVNKQDPTKAFGCTQYGNLKHTTDALQPSYGDYTAVTAGGFKNNYPNFITQFAGNNADGKQIYMPTNTEIKRTLDDGVTFTTIGTHALKAVKVATESATNPVVYVVGYDGNTNSWESNIIRIDNAASTPSVSTKANVFDYWSGGRPDQIMIDPNDRNTVYVTTSGGEAFKVTDLNTDDWKKESIKGNISDVVFNVVIGMKGQPNVLIAGTNVGLFYSQDAGTTWTVSNDIPYTQVTDLRLRDSDNRLFVFTYGRGAWATTVNTTVLGLNTNTKLVEVKIFPNPSNDYITINTDSKSDVKVFDAKGAEVINGTTNQKIDITTLSSGLYIVHIINEGELVGVEKIVVE